MAPKAAGAGGAPQQGQQQQPPQGSQQQVRYTMPAAAAAAAAAVADSLQRKFGRRGDWSSVDALVFFCLALWCTFSVLSGRWSVSRSLPFFYFFWAGMGSASDRHASCRCLPF